MERLPTKLLHNTYQIETFPIICNANLCSVKLFLVKCIVYYWEMLDAYQLYKAMK